MPKKKSPREEAGKLKELVELRAQVAMRRPRFLRQESWRFVRIRPEWRKPKGVDSKMRKSRKGWPRLVKVGYRGPRESRYLHPSAHYEVMVHNPRDLESVVPGRDVARIGRTVGARKRSQILGRAKELGVTVVNPTGLRFIEPKK